MGKAPEIVEDVFADMEITLMNPENFTPTFLCDLLGMQIKSKKALKDALQKMRPSEVSRFFHNVPMVLKIRNLPNSLYYDVGGLIFTSKENVSALKLSIAEAYYGYTNTDSPELHYFYKTVQESIAPIYWLVNLGLF